MTEKMNSKELCETAIWREEDVDRVPFCPPFQGYWALGIAGLSTRESIENPRASAEAQFKMIKECGIDGAETMWDWLLPVEYLGCKVKIPENGTIPTQTHIIADREALDRLEVPDIEDIRDFYRLKSARECTGIMAKEIGGDHFLMASLLNPFTLGGEIRGVDNLLMDCFIDREFAEAVVKKCIEIDKVFAQEICSWDVDSVILCDPTASGDMISGEDYHILVEPSAAALGKVVRDGGKTQINHVCGNTTDRLGYVADTGCAAFSLDYQVDIGKAVEASKDRMAIIGNLNPAGVIFSGTVEDARRETSRIAKEGGKRGFLFGSGCDIPVGSPIENVKAISEALRNC